MKKNTMKGIGTMTELRKSQGSHLRLFDDYTKHTLERLYHLIEIEDTGLSIKQIEKYKYLIQEKLAYNHVHKKVNNYKNQYTYSHKMYKDKYIANVLFNILYRPFDFTQDTHHLLRNNIVTLFSDNVLVSSQELARHSILPPNMQPEYPVMMQSFEDLWYTVQWIDRQKNLFSKVRKRKLDLFCLLK